MWGGAHESLDVDIREGVEDGGAALVRPEGAYRHVLLEDPPDVALAVDVFPLPHLSRQVIGAVYQHSISTNILVARLYSHRLARPKRTRLDLPKNGNRSSGTRLLR